MSIAHPGGNITGFSHFEYALATQWVELLKQIAPRISRIAVLYAPSNKEFSGVLPIMDEAARAHTLQMSSYPVRSGSEIEHTLDTFAREPNGGLILLPGPVMATQHELIISLATKHRLPNLYVFRYYPANGGLASYGADNVDLYRRAADYIDRILKGEKPANLPVQFPTKYELVINLRAAKAIGIEVATPLLVRADEVIE